jgi:alanine racemase
MYFSELPLITGGEIISFKSDQQVDILLTDSRKPVVNKGAVFFAISGKRNDGHHYLETLYELGIRQFVVEKWISGEDLPEANILKVDSSISALQQIASHHRHQFSIPVIGITGSNAKTIIKEWLFQLLSYDRDIIKNPGSYNSQLGVPLSVWQMQSHHKLGIFEAGISRLNEMQNLQRIIDPVYGIFTNIGTSHDENFPDRETKIKEKLKLFEKVSLLIYCADHYELTQQIKSSAIPTVSWGRQHADVIVNDQNGKFLVSWKGSAFHLQLPFVDAASVENALHCVVMMLVLGYDPKIINQRIHMLQAIPMRLELKEGINNCLVIDDTYNNDLGGLRISLDFLNHQKQRSNRTLILSDIIESGLPDDLLVDRIAELVNRSGVSRFIGIGNFLFTHQEAFKIPSLFFQSTEHFLEQTTSQQFQNETILVKGARIFRFERITKRLTKKAHGTVMEINLGALVHNLNYFRSLLHPGTKIMAMVKAFAYGSGSVTIANVLQFHQVEYLGVAYADEGVELRQNNITVPIMVMNPSEDGFQLMLDFALEPEIYSTKILDELIRFLDGRPMKVHIKLDTGMHRLGFDDHDLDTLIALLAQHRNIRIASVFSHLAGADEQEHDDFTHKQARQFLMEVSRIKEQLQINPLVHLLNTPGILRFPEYQMDMVRLGIGMYGVDPVSQNHQLKPVATLKTIISQKRHVKRGESIGYGRRGIAAHDIDVATIAIGYADGYSRAFSNGSGVVLVNGKRAPVIGNVCMDMTMIDVTGLDAREGDEVIVFGEALPLHEVAARINTIPYEILTNTSERVKRIFVAESI